MTKISNNQGLSIIEVIFAILLTFLLLSGLTAAMVFTVKAARFSRNKSTGIQIAKQALEDIKGQRSDSWWAGLTVGCGSKEVVAGYDQFKKDVCYSNIDVSGNSNQATVVVHVYWGSDDQEVASLSTILTNWDQ